MRQTTLVVLAALALAASPALAQQPAAGTVAPADDRADIVSPLPSPAVDENAPPATFLRAARSALYTGDTGLAQEAMERAESRLLSRAVRPSLASQPSRQPLVTQIAAARDALSSGNRLQAIELLDAALKNPEADTSN